MDTNFEDAIQRLKEQNWEKLLKDLADRTLPQVRVLLKYDYPGISEEELEKKVSEYPLFNDQVMTDFKNMFDPLFRADHPADWAGIDLSPYIEELKKCDTEKLIVISFRNGQITNVTSPLTNNSTVGVGEDQMMECLRATIAAGKPGTKVIRMHNHPLAGCAIPSTTDKKLAYLWLLLLKSFRMDFVDDVIVTPIDVYSQDCYETRHPEEFGIFSNQLSKESWNKIKEENKALWFALKL